MNEAVTIKPYLERELIEGITYQIDPDYVYIGNNHTCFIRQVKADVMFAREDILSMIDKIVVKAKANSLKVKGTRKARQFIKTHWEEYVNQIKEGNDLFDEIRKKAEEVKVRGIHYGALDDDELSELTKLSWKYQEIYWRTTEFSKMRRLQSYLSRMLYKLNFPDTTHIGGTIYIII